MAEYSITFARSARKEMEDLDRSVSLRVLKRIETLQHDPRPSGCIKLQGTQNLWRLRVGDYRVIYSIWDSRNLIDVSAVRHRSDAYR